MEDAAYDVLYDELKALEDADPSLVTSDSPTQRVGAPLSDKFQKAQHLLPMGSLEKVTTDEALQKWEDDMRKRLATDEPIAFVVEPKIDGSAINLMYENGRFVRGLTRGDGVQGEDVTPNLRTIKAIPLQMRGNGAPPVLEVRGEVYMPLQGFRAANEALAAEEKPTWPNPRNAAAGLAPPEGLDDHGGASALDLGVRHGLPRRRRSRNALGDAAVAARARLPDEPLRAAARVDRRGRRARARLGAAPHRRSTTRSTASSSRSTRTTSRSGSARCTGGRAGRAPSSGRP